MAGYFEDSIPVATRVLSETRAFQGTVSPAYPVVPSRGKWAMLPEPIRYTRQFQFSNPQMLIDFVNEVLNYQESSGHHGKLTIVHNSVDVEVYTHDVNTITELDQEYTHTLDDIYNDVQHYAYDKGAKDE